MESSVKILMKFRPGDTEKPFVHLFATQFGLVFSILQADISPDRGGRMVLDLSGEREGIDKALAFAAAQGVTVKVLSRAVHWDEDACVHCGACTAVCVQKALSLDRDSWTLSFDNARCVVCEMCVKACPCGALRVELHQ